MFIRYCLREILCQMDRFGPIAHGRVRMRGQEPRQIVSDDGELRIQSQGLAEFRQRLGNPPLPPQDGSDPGPGHRQFRIDGYHLVIFLQRFLPLLLTLENGAQLTIVQHEDSRANNRNYWNFFEPYLRNAEPLMDPGRRSTATTERTRISRRDVQQAIEDIRGRWESSGRPSYSTVAAKEIAVSAAGLHRPPTAGEHGTECGTVIHFLLETAMRQPAADLHDLAYTALEEQGLELGRVDEALKTVNSVMRSDIWRRAQESERVLVEVPFRRCLPPEHSEEGVPTVLRGVIDLVFHEAGEWVVVDYKTDVAAATQPQREKLVDHYRGQVEFYAKAWEDMIMQPVREKAIFFTTSQEYVAL